MITQFKIFEGYYDIVDLLYSDEYLNIGKMYNNEIVFKFKSKKYSMTTGVAKILGTKYEKDENIRSIKIDVKPSGPGLNGGTTKKSVSKIFLKSFGFDDDYIESNYIHFSYPLTFKDMIKKSNTLGELIDYMRELQNKYEFENNIKKYNL